jgi:ATP-dependent helicase HrpA
MLTARQNIKYLAKNLPRIDKMCLYYANIDTCEHLKDDLLIAIVDEAFFEKEFDIEPVLVRDQSEFEQRCDRAKRQLISIANQRCERVFNSLQTYHQVVKSIKQHTALNQLQAISDIKEQLSLLIYPNFVVNTPGRWLEHLPRYLQGIDIRLHKLQQSLAADQQRQNQLLPYWQKLVRQLETDPDALSRNAAWSDYRWMLEEMRISLFAQNLKTSIPVSNKRLDEQLAKIKKG